MRKPPELAKDCPSCDGTGGYGVCGTCQGKGVVRPDGRRWTPEASTFHRPPSRRLAWVRVPS